MKEPEKILSAYLPPDSVLSVIGLLKKHKVHLRITRNRTSKHGDFRPPGKDGLHRISVNSTLNPYHFLLTLLHEIGHVQTWGKYRNKARPHGREWKEAYAALLDEFESSGIFPDPLDKAIKKFIRKPLYTASADNELLKVLRQFDNEQYTTIEDIPEGSRFRLHNKVIYIKLEKLRKRYKCRREDNNRYYTIGSLTKVEPV
ncbi:MAG: hypothetical protein K8R53_12810 [Bacteroidales bacterium]|nr:hypothetical protein [Bacteroidales bacterium]